MVKPNSDVWRYYDLKDKDNYFCKYCKTSFKRNATRQFQHLLKCVKIPENVVQILKKGKLPIINVSSSNNNTTPSSTEVLEDSDADDTDTTSQQGQGESLDSEIASLVRPVPSSASSSFSSTTKASKGTISSYFDNMSSQENNKIDEILARAIYVSGAPLDMTTKKVWLDVFKAMRCAYKPPSRYQLSNPLLESEYTRVKAAVSSKISEAPILSLQMDGWSNCRNDSISNFVINTPLPVFYKSIHTENNRHLATFLASEIEKVLKELGASTFPAIVTDNRANIKKAREIVSSKYDYITNYGCIYYGLNLLVEVFLKLDHFSNFKKNIISIVSELKNSQILHATFEKIQLDKTGRHISFV
nr:uncharacterized protein LOC111423030 [Onthophagus taurus]